MNRFIVNGILLLVVFSVPLVMAADKNDYGGQEEGKERDHEDVEDYSGVSLEIPRKTQELIGLKTVPVESSSIVDRISVTGRISQNVDETTEVFSPQEGVLKECPVSIGSSVSKDDVICVIENTGKEQMEIKSPVAGVLMAEFAKSGDKVDTMVPTHTVADLTKLYANFDVYEKDMGKVRQGERVLAYSSAYPEKVFKGKITFVSPQVDETSFTIKIGVQIKNPDLLLKPGMFLRAEILLEDRGAHLSVPSDAVQNLAGKMMVFLQDEPESFTATEVSVKLASRKHTYIEGDIKAGDRVVSDGAYIIKSKMMESEITGGCAHGH